MNKRIIIIGGMGPQASIELHQRIISSAAMHGAVEPHQFPEIVHVSLPVRDFIASEKTRDLALRQITDAMHGLCLGRDDKIVLACNTAHLLQPAIEEAIDHPLVSLIDHVLDVLSEDQTVTVGVLASPVTLRTKLYEHALNGAGMNMVKPSLSDMRLTEALIRQTISNNKPAPGSLLPIINRLRANGAEKVILGCTELSVIMGDQENHALIDPLSVIADKLMSEV